MKILGLDVDGFGVWQGLKLRGLSPRVTVIHGPNEAGKTTLMQFIRAMFYGFSAERRARYLPPLRGGRAGGRLQLDDLRGPCTLQRHDDPIASVEGLVRLIRDDNDVELEGASAIEASRPRIDEPIFRNVFAVGMREIQELGALSDTAAADKLFKLATGLGRVSLIETLRDVADSRRRLLDGDAPASRIKQLGQQRQRLREEIEQLRPASADYVACLMQRTRIDEEIASIDAQLKALDEKSTWLERVLAARDPWQRRATLLAELKPLAGLPDLGDDALGAFENHARRTSLWHKRLRQVRRRTAKLRRTVDRQPVSDALVRQGPRVEALIEQRTWLKSIVDDVGRLEARIEAATKQLGDHRESLGLPRQVDAKRGFDPAVLDRIRPAYKALRSAQSRRLQARRASDAPVVDDGRAAEQMAKALKGRGDGDLHTAIEQAGTLVAKLRRRVQLDERLAEMSRQQGDLAGQGRALVEHQLLPLKLLMALGAVFVLGCVCILAGLLLPTTFVGPIGWGLVGLGIVSTVTALGVKFWFEHSAEVEFEGAQQRAAQLATQIEQAKAERDELDKQLPRGGGPLLTRLAAAEKEQTELEALLPLHAQQTSATRQQQSAQAHYKRCQADWQSAEQRWRQALSSAGLPATLSIKQVRALMSQRDVLEDLNREIVRHRDELAERRKALDSLTGRITQVATDAQLDLSGWQRAGASVASPLELLDRLEQLWKSEQQLQAQRLERQQRHLKLTKLARKASRAYQKHRTAAKALLDKAGVRTATKFRALVERSRQRAQLAERADAVATELERLFTGADAQRFHDEATNRGYPEIEREHLAVVEHRARLNSRMRELAEVRGRLAERLTTFGTDRRLADKRVDLEVVEQQLREAIERWRVLGVIHHLLSDIRRRFEVEHQPEALKEASRWLVRLTEGHYTRVWTPLEADVLRVDDAAGQSLAVEVLSRGTREQLFLGLRLALVDLYARHGVRLPLVLDDVLVNFDAARARAAAQVLCDFADEGHQVLMFTCHEHIAELFGSLGATILRLPSNSNTEAAPRPAPPIEPVVAAPLIETPVVETPVVEAPAPKPMVETPIVAAPAVETSAVEEPAPPKRPRRRPSVVPRPKSMALRAGRFATSNWHESKHEEPAHALNGHDESNGHGASHV